MATSGSFKKTARQARNITVEDFFDKGIYMTDSALATGLCGNLVNYRVDANTGHLKARGGLRPKLEKDICTVSAVDLQLIKYKEYYPIRSDLLINDQDKVHTFSTIACLITPEQTLGAWPSPTAPTRVSEGISPGGPYDFSLQNTIFEDPQIGDLVRYSEYFYKIVDIQREDSIEYLLLAKAFVYREVPNVNRDTVIQTTADDALILLDDDQTLSLTRATFTPPPHAQGTFPELTPDVLYNVGLKNGVHIIKDMPAFNTLPELLGCTLLNTFVGICTDGLYKYKITETSDSDSIALERIVPKNPDAAFAVKYGYNMLKGNAAYQFANNLAAQAMEFQGLLPYEYNIANPFAINALPHLDYKQGEHVLFQLFYRCRSDQYPASSTTQDVVAFLAKFKFEMRTGESDEWTTYYADGQGGLTSAIRFDYTGGHIGVHIIVPADNFQIRVFYNEGESDQCFGIFSFSGGAEEDGTTKITTPIYDLTTAQGMFSWKRRAGLYGVKGAPNVVFLSDIDDPSYFPYPNNIIEYDYPVLKVINFLDDIMVFTTDGIYQTELGTDGNSYITKQTVGNIHLTASDMYAVQTIKNMLFYKADNRYYMLVPSTKYTTLNQLQVAPISAPINYLLDNFEIEFRKILHAMYGSWENVHNVDDGISYFDTFITTEGSRCNITPTVYSSFVDGDVVKLNYGFCLEGPFIDKIHIVYTLMYDTLHKMWLSDIVELSSLEVLNMYRRSILGTSQYILTNITQRVNEDETSKPVELTIAVLQEAVDTLQDYNIDDSLKHFPTRQFLDTGYRDINSAWKKRFREIQFKLTTNLRQYELDNANKTEAYKAIYLNPKFKIDNDLRNDGDVYYLYREEEVPMYYLGAKEFYLVAKGDTHLEEDGLAYYPGAEQDLFFKLDEETLTDATINVLRFKVTGKGRCPRVQLNVHTKVPYELHNVAWVFRNMNAR